MSDWKDYIDELMAQDQFTKLIIFGNVDGGVWGCSPESFMLSEQELEPLIKYFNNQDKPIGSVLLQNVKVTTTGCVAFYFPLVHRHGNTT